MAAPKSKIGLEIHVQLATESKLFCSCPTRAEEPNTATCEVCLGMPGSKPALNRRAVDYAAMVALALNCEINREFFFSRKTYFYPDLAKNYQITQYEAPVGEGGFLEVDGVRVKIRRVHLEEDPASLVHESGSGSSAYSLVDYNRSGIPLAEIVTEPDIQSPEHARHFMDELLKILGYLGIYRHGESVLKADCNLSIEGGERVEVKNVTGFRAIEDALAAEYARQVKVVSDGGKIGRETRGFDAEKGTTYLMRKKETEEDYGYIFDADLAKAEVDEKWLSDLKAKMPELAAQKAKRFVAQYGLKEYDAKVLSIDRPLAEIYEHVVKTTGEPHISSVFISGTLCSVLNYNKLNITDTKITASGISDLVNYLKQKQVSEKNAKESLIKYALEGTEPKEFLEKNKLLIEGDSSDVEGAVREIASANKAAFDEFRGGNIKSLNFLIGLVMRKLKGKADARTVQKILEEMK